MMASRRDAFIAAGHMACRRCDGVRFPFDAAWLEHDLVIVIYGSCLCLNGAPPEGPDLYVIRPSELPLDDRCMATTVRGTRCRRLAVDGLCAQHAPDRVRRNA